MHCSYNGCLSSGWSQVFVIFFVAVASSCLSSLYNTVHSLPLRSADQKALRATLPLIPELREVIISLSVLRHL